MKRLITFLLALMLTWIGANAQIVSGGTYMLQNVKTEYFLGGGGSWGTQAVTLARPQQFTITSSNGGYTLHSYQGSKDGGYLTTNLYVDTGTSDVDWTITEGSGENAGTYTISCSSGYLSAAGAEKEDVAIKFSDTEEYWRIISPDDIKADMESATADNPVDVTGLIMNPTLNAKSNGTSAGSTWWGYWTVTGYNTSTEINNCNFSQHDVETCARVVETWHSNDGFDIRQTITDLPAGLYKFSAQGFYRVDGSVTTYPVIYAEPTGTTNEVTLKNLDSSDEGKAVVNTGTAGMATAYSAFLDGYYPNEIEFIMSDEGSATIGFRSDLTTSDDMWTVFGEINLYYYGEVEVADEDADYEVDDEIEMHNFKGTVASGNLFKNGGFNNGVTGWTAGSGYTNALSESDVTIHQFGGYNHGPYVTLNASGASDSKTPTQAIAVTPGKSYLLVGYTKYSGSDDDLPNSRYSALFAMKSATAERSHYEDASNSSYSDDLVQLKIENTGNWVQTEGIFTVPAADADSTFSYVGMRMNWSTASYDGLQLYELNGEFTFPEDADYVKGDEVTSEDVTYIVSSDNLFVNGSFNERTTGWTYGNTYTNPLGSFEVNYSNDGGYNDGPYITSKGGGSSANTTPSQAVAITSGKTYLFVGYTKGTTPTGNEKYNGLMQMTDATTEENSGSDPIEYVQMNWGDGDANLNGWTKTEKVFTATTSHAGVRFAWCPDASFDGIQLYELEALPSSVTWTMTDANWGTLILPFAVAADKVPTDLTIYNCTGTETDEETQTTTVTVTEVEDGIAANTPYLVQGNVSVDTEYTFSGTPEEAEGALTQGLLTGTFVNMDYDALAAVEATSGTVYLLQNHTDGDGVAFYPVVTTGESSEATLTPYHCYLTLSSASGVRAYIGFPDSGETTAIVAVEGAEAEGNGAIYDLSGRKVSKAVKGVYIQNGKKVLVK